ncbi:MAG: hypothetical protein H6829_06575 [Planctomycetes bacterium]|nr:hypothetical protein [Planctomycetota bacterium]MCB9912943.1 hypothetical protein [Planctomycetota bacterium]HPF13710.1 hypothetical protein [Planctomycetota bacterium]HRV79879.1 hypothetical protein [Planctomycetota bacterium]
MNQRVWILVLAGSSFLAGMAVSSLWQGGGHSDEAPYEAFADRFERQFQLSPERSRFLRELLYFHHIAVQRIEDRHRSALDTSLGQELDAEAQRFRALIRDNVLSPDQRESYDRLLAGTSQSFPPR